jgi:spermidine synthase
MRVPLWVFLFLFTLSGFAGLIYESIWSHYLKLFLGHAAYAQTLVLALFMGGMALGSGLAGHFATRIRRAMLGYAAAELVIGLMALTFHGTFGTVTTWAFDVLLPTLGSPLSIEIAKWSIATLLILPPSILLGTTFPLMSGGIMRRYGDSQGRSLPALYFTNSLGAAIGVLASGFLLIENLGLPGTILTAGMVNVLLAVMVWLLSQSRTEAGGTVELPRGAAGANLSPFRLLYLAAFVTGAASFVFEIAWIRMLTLAVGASTHSFEVMLSAFILGIALGGLLLTVWQKRILKPGQVLAWVIVAKCLLALGAVMFYPWLLDLVRWLHQGLGRTAQGYSLFVMGSYGVSVLMMVPTAICAGMTLPLITRSLLAQGAGEPAVGRVYAANTLGAIVGTILATHAGLELLGVKGLTGAAALVEAVLAVCLLRYSATLGGLRLLRPALPIAFVFIFYGFFFALDPLKMASGVYRDGQFFTPDAARILSHHHGKTATISVIESAGVRDIRTNGKTDASVNLMEGAPPSADEHTMALAAILPFIYSADAKRVANIGFGSGLTTHALLGNPSITEVDSIEIERAMIEGARLFRPRNELAYTDPRSRIHIEDAKTFFASRQSRYDIIISEPSNPWVSGVATLFSEEFYRRVRSHLADDGLLVQWLQLYETDPRIVASIMKALGGAFSDYVIHHSAGGDVIIVAKAKGALNAPLADPFLVPAWKETLNRLGYASLDELGLTRVAGRQILQPLFDGFPVRANSDFFPFVDLSAPRARFVGASAMDLVGIAREGNPLAALIEGERLPGMATQHGAAERVVAGVQGHQPRLRHARTVVAGMTSSSAAVHELSDHLRARLGVIRLGATTCPVEFRIQWLEAVETTVVGLSGTLDGKVVAETLDRLMKGACGRALTGLELTRFEFLRAVVSRDRVRMELGADKLIADAQSLPISTRDLVWTTAVSTRIARGAGTEAREWMVRAVRLGVWPQNTSTRVLESYVISGSSSARGGSGLPVSGG